MELLKKKENPTTNKIVGISNNRKGRTRSSRYNCAKLPRKSTKIGRDKNKNEWNGNEIFEFVVDIFSSIVCVIY